MEVLIYSIHIFHKHLGAQFQANQCPSPQQRNGRGPHEQLLCCTQLFHPAYSKELTLPPDSALRRQNSSHACRTSNFNFQDLCPDKNHISFTNYLGILLIQAHENP